MQLRQHPKAIRHVDLSDVQLASSETARGINRNIVLELIRANQPLSRADLSRRSGLQRSTVSQIVEQLIRRELGARGRHCFSGARTPSHAFRTERRPDGDCGRPASQQATIAMVDLNGRLLSRSLAPLTSNPVASSRLLTECIKRMRHEFPGKSIEGIGISLPGRVDPATQRMIFAPNLHWSDFDLKGAIEKEIGLTVSMENAATACLLAELLFGRLNGIRDAVLVTVSEGVGTGVFANGQVITGNHGMAGEFGHVSLDPSGVQCACGRRGCWETFASCHAALRYYSELAAQSRGNDISRIA